jgi:hypothetical protein
MTLQNFILDSIKRQYLQAAILNSDKEPFVVDEIECVDSGDSVIAYFRSNDNIALSKVIDEWCLSTQGRLPLPVYYQYKNNPTVRQFVIIGLDDEMPKIACHNNHPVV